MPSEIAHLVMIDADILSTEKNSTYQNHRRNGSNIRKSAVDTSYQQNFFRGSLKQGRWGGDTRATTQRLKVAETLYGNSLRGIACIHREQGAVLP